ncbi:hypothetical protein Hgul01_01238 [Herpetosiphon gulosus]|uniref:Uncharacterized protein n=1 Tax=Herpetosiphon gulosus TaxID=1973496 RepID=A0ABP9WW88_9CHLR
MPSPPNPLSRRASEGNHRRMKSATPLARRSGRGAGGEGTLKPTLVRFPPGEGTEGVANQDEYAAIGRDLRKSLCARRPSARGSCLRGCVSPNVQLV